MPRGITIVGLGPGEPGLLTTDAHRALEEAIEVYVRTRRHPTVEGLRLSATIHSFDDAYERGESFAQVYAEIASHIVELGAREQGVLYAVPGHPLVGEASVGRILDLAQQQGLPVRIVEGLSFVEPVCTALGLDPMDGLQLCDATALAMRNYPEHSPDLPLLVGQLYSRGMASDVKLALMALYPDDHPVSLVQAAGTTRVSVRTMPLYELDRGDDMDHLSSLFVPPLAQPGSLAAFQEVVARLRAPGGCPWDREQTHRSLRPYLLEEAYEVLQALDQEDMDSLREELGDLLLQILLHTQIAIEQQEFQMFDVVSHIVSKLQRRHPHVFGQVQVSGSEDVLANWERIKSEERNHRPRSGLSSGVPRSLPALARAQALLSRAARSGLHTSTVGEAQRLVENGCKELPELSTTGERGDALGSLLFHLVGLAQQYDLDAESALRKAVERYEQQIIELESRKGEEQREQSA